MLNYFDCDATFFYLRIMHSFEQTAEAFRNVQELVITNLFKPKRLL